MIIGTVILKAGFGQDISGIGFKIIANVFWNMGITSDGDDLTAKFFV